ncbi:MAG: cobalamin B12-binding domain-containing protein [Marivita sp.]|uniref:cobalamin B12-binding domain-containing protein n=1 Tax=Marivita sp. TaxID=2003365 RepID=UPI003EF87E8A
MLTTDIPIFVRAIDDDAHGQVPRLSDASLLVMAQEVITRLSHISRNSRSEISNADLDAFSMALTNPSATEANMILRRAHENGASHQTLCLSYIAAAANRLGEWWEQDIIHFSDMAIAAGRMLHMLRDLRMATPPVPVRGNREALFAAVPGEQHVLGVTMATDILREKGWDIDLHIGRSETELCKIAHDGGYPIIGLSASGAEQVRSLARTIVELRIAAPRSLIFISGNIVQIERDIAIKTGADAAASTMQHSLETLEALYQTCLKAAKSAP